MKKKAICFGLVSSLFIMLLIGMSVGNTLPIRRLFADNEPQYSCYGNVRIETDGEGGYEITHIGEDATDVEIPSEINGVPVTTITVDAFEDCKDNLTSVTIDGNVNIEEGTFNDCPNELDITFTGDATELTYGAIFEHTTIGTMTIPASVTYVSPETFYGVTDTTNLIYNGSFENFWSGIFPSLWTAFTSTLNSEGYSSASMPTNIVVNGVTYFIPEDTNRATFLSTTSVYYFATQPSSNIRTSQLPNQCSFGVNGTTYYNHV